jgi:membrane-associated phospholipid phosphatase
LNLCCVGPALQRDLFLNSHIFTCLSFAAERNRMNKKTLPTKYFAVAAVITALTGVYLITTSFIIGRNNFFLLLNTDIGSAADTFFAFWTWLGDGLIWIPVAVLFFLYRKDKIPLLAAAIIISTLIVQLTKSYLFPDTPRPTLAIENTNAIHLVPGVEVHTAVSFPSGHTTTAFTLFLLICLVTKKKWVIPFAFLYALLVGYSRIYLAQHFPLDVGAGMLAAVITVLLSIPIQEAISKSRRRNIE